ncbi:MAG: hypothetical protein AAF725_18835, partial [Acidobacteriota bacterium]
MREKTRALSVFAAAAGEPERIALVLEDADASARGLSFRQLAARVLEACRFLDDDAAAGREGFALVAEPGLESLLIVYAAIETGRPVTLLHPRW